MSSPRVVITGNFDKLLIEIFLDDFLRPIRPNSVADVILLADSLLDHDYVNITKKFWNVSISVGNAIDPDTLQHIFSKNRMFS